MKCCDLYLLASCCWYHYLLLYLYTNKTCLDLHWICPKWPKHEECGRGSSSNIESAITLEGHNDGCIFRQLYSIVLVDTVESDLLVPGESVICLFQHTNLVVFLPKLVALCYQRFLFLVSEISSSFSLRHSSALHFVFGRKMFRSCPALAGGVGETKVVVVARQLLIPLSGSQTKNAEGLTIRAFGTMLGKGSRCWHEMLKGDSKVTRCFNRAQLRLWMKLKRGAQIFSNEFALRSFNKSLLI